MMQRYKKLGSFAKICRVFSFIQGVNLGCDVLDYSYHSTEEDTALAEVPERGVVDDVFFREKEVKPDQRMA